MARRNNLSIEEQIEKKEIEIANLTEQLKTAKADLKKLNDEKQMADTHKLMIAIEESGKTIDEVLNMLKETLIN